MTSMQKLARKLPSLKWTLSLLLLPLFLCQTALADIILLKDGRRIEGEIVDQTSETLKIKVNSFAIVEVAASQVKSIVSKETPWKIYERRFKAIDPKDSDKYFDLALWCKSHSMPKRYRELLKLVLAISPDYAKARLASGYVLDNGKWISEADFYEAKGFERYKGKWLPKDEVKLARAKTKLEKDIKKYLIDFRRGRQKALAAESAILELEPAELAGPILLGHLDDKKVAVRLLIVRAFAQMGFSASSSELLKLAQEDSDYDVAKTAAIALWSFKANEFVDQTKTSLVQGLFANSKKTRLRTAFLLSEVRDPKTIPYLIEGLYLVKVKVVTKVKEISGVSRGGVRRRGLFGEYNLPTGGRSSLGQVQRVKEKVYSFNSAARKALKAMTATDFDYDKEAWFKWWKTEGSDRFLNPKKKQP